MYRAGTPPTVAEGGTLLVTTAPAATVAPSPTSTPARITLEAPSHTSISIWTGAEVNTISRRGTE